MVLLRRLSSCAGAALDFDVVVIGAGVVGLAVARHAALAGRQVAVLDTAGAYGTATSSRNSEVIHAGLYYPTGSLKAQLCVSGAAALHDFCAAHGVASSPLGKLVVAADETALPSLRALHDQGTANGVLGLELLSAGEARGLEPELRCAGALLSPGTGVVDSHGLMAELARQLEAAGGTLALRSRLLRADLSRAAPSSGGCIQLEAEDAGSGERVRLAAGALVNAAGLWAQAVAARLEGLPGGSIPELHLAKGSYFTMAGRAPFSRLVYPLPQEGGLGVHLTLDLSGAARFGPDVEWLPAGTDPGVVDYRVEAARSAAFYPAVRSYWPGLRDGALQPGYAGVRPKVSGPGQPAGDFVLSGEAAHGVPGVVCLYGIESPGLTACLAIARRVAGMLGIQGGPGS